MIKIWFVNFMYLIAWRWSRMFSILKHGLPKNATYINHSCNQACSNYCDLFAHLMWILEFEPETGLGGIGKGVNLELKVSRLTFFWRWVIGRCSNALKGPKDLCFRVRLIWVAFTSVPIFFFYTTTRNSRQRTKLNNTKVMPC